MQWLFRGVLLSIEAVNPTEQPSIGLSLPKARKGGSVFMQM